MLRVQRSSTEFHGSGWTLRIGTNPSWIKCFARNTTGHIIYSPGEEKCGLFFLNLFFDKARGFKGHNKLPVTVQSLENTRHQITVSGSQDNSSSYQSHNWRSSWLSRKTCAQTVLFSTTTSRKTTWLNVCQEYPKRSLSVLKWMSWWIGKWQAILSPTR